MTDQLREWADTLETRYPNDLVIAEIVAGLRLTATQLDLEEDL